jgi:hypothetical protein
VVAGLVEPGQELLTRVGEWARRRNGVWASERVAAIFGAKRFSREAATHNSLGRSPRDVLANDLALKARDKFGQVPSDTAQSRNACALTRAFSATRPSLNS